MKIAVVVAHYDDEIIWCGGTVERLASLGTVDTFFMFEELIEGKWKYTGLKPLPDLIGYDVILTHGEMGEYGHKDHVKLNREILTKYRGKVMTFGGAWDFGQMDYLVKVTPPHVFNKARGLKEYEKAGKNVAEICYIQCQCALEGGKLFIDNKEVRHSVMVALDAREVGYGGSGSY